MYLKSIVIFLFKRKFLIKLKWSQILPETEKLIFMFSGAIG